MMVNCQLCWVVTAMSVGALSGLAAGVDRRQAMPIEATMRIEVDSAIRESTQLTASLLLS